MFDKNRIEKTLREIDKDIRKTEEKIKYNKEYGFPTKRLEGNLQKLYENRHTFKEMLNKQALKSFKIS